MNSKKPKETKKKAGECRNIKKKMKGLDIREKAEKYKWFE